MKDTASVAMASKAAPTLVATPAFKATLVVAVRALASNRLAITAAGPVRLRFIGNRTFMWPITLL